MNKQRLNEILSENMKAQEPAKQKDEFAKLMEDLDVNEFIILLEIIIRTDEKLKDAKDIDINKAKELIIKEELNGNKFKQFKRKEFIKLFKSIGMKGFNIAKVSIL